LTANSSLSPPVWTIAYAGARPAISSINIPFGQFLGAGLLHFWDKSAANYYGDFKKMVYRKEFCPQEKILITSEQRSVVQLKFDSTDASGVLSRW
jgi:hypothetical protein